MSRPTEESTRTYGLSAGSVVGDYTVVRKLGSGAMGEVHEAVGRSGERVALKLLHATAGSVDGQRRFVREARLCAELRHPNVVSVSDHGVHAGSPFFVMPLLRGRDLEQWLAATGALRPEVAVAIVLQACAGVRAAHEAGIVHRDLKPANVFLDERGGDIRVTVCDFGVAKVCDEDGSLTASGAVIGTPLYMAAEQLLNSKRVDARCDVWALGMILYTLLTGCPALEHKRSIGDLVLALNENAIPPVQTRAPWVTPALARVVHAALLPIDQRLATVQALEDALLRWAPGERRLTLEQLVPVPEERKAVVATRATLPRDATELQEQGDDTVGGDEHAPDEGPDTFLGRSLADRYRVVARIGSGGMGAVYEAIDTSVLERAETRGQSPFAIGDDTRVVAVKVMHPEQGPRALDAIRRFLREAKASSRIESAHVTRFLDSGVDAATGAPFLVMERLRGRDLATHLATSGALEVGPAVTLFLQACDALRAAHALGIVHRDIKPSNLFLHEEGRSVSLKVCDFGIAKQLTRDGVEASTELTRTGGMIGSPLYMSPEQAKSAKNVDERTDIFSLALTLHETLSGVRPWEGRTSMGEIIVAVCTENVPALAALAPWVDSELSAVLEKGLQRDVANRFATIDDFAKALERFGERRPLAQEDLVGIPSVRRARAGAQQRGWDGAVSPVTQGGMKITGDAVSVTSASGPARHRSRRLTALGVVGLVVASATAAVLAVRPKVGATDARPTLAQDGPSVALAAASLPSSVASVGSAAASGSATASANAAAASSGPIAASTKPASGKRPTSALDAGHGATTSTAMTSVTAPTTPPTSSVGRGFTATDIPDPTH